MKRTKADAIDEVAATCRALRAELQKAESLWSQVCRERNDAVALLQRAAGIHAPNTPWTVKETVLSWGAWYRDYRAFRDELISRLDGEK